MPGRRLVIGDIHGCWTALQAVLAAAQVTSEDQLITLGDYVDRGPDSRQVVEWLIETHRGGNLVPLRGNHEIMMLDAATSGGEVLRGWLSVGGKETLRSYSQSDARLTVDQVPALHMDFLQEKLLPYYETAHHVFVHANAYADLAMDEQPDYMLYWESWNQSGPPARPHNSGKILVCGHTAQRSGQPNNAGHAICIDTWVYGNGWLTCLEPATGQYWQANQQGETRSAWL